MSDMVLIDDNCHQMDSSYRCRGGTFATVEEEAISRCRQIVAEDAAPVTFSMYSAWDHARQRCEERCAGVVARRLPPCCDAEHADYDPLS